MRSDDSGYYYRLPNGISLMGYYRINNRPCEMDSLEGVDGFIYITSKKELDDLISKTAEEIFDDIKLRNPKFNKEEWL